MSEPSKPPTPAEIVTAELGRRGAEFLPGGAEALGQTWASLATWAPAARAAEIEKRMSSGLAKRYVDPNFTAEHPTALHKAIHLNRHRIADTEVPHLVTALALRMNGKASHQVVGELVKHLDARDAATRRGQPIGSPAQTRRADGTFASETPATSKPPRKLSF